MFLLSLRCVEAELDMFDIVQVEADGSRVRFTSWQSWSKPGSAGRGTVLS